MRIVYLLTGRQVLAADEWRNGTVYTDPSALDIYPAFDPIVHGTFIKDGALLPSDLKTYFSNYQVDDPVTPTDVLLKYGIRVVLATTQMIADGKSSQQVSFEIRDSLGSGGVITTGSHILNLTTKGGFVTPKQVTTSGGYATATFYSGRDTSFAKIMAFDTLGALALGESSSISLESSVVYTDPVDYVGKPHSKRNFYLVPSNGTANPVGVVLGADANGVPGNTTAGIGTLYETPATLDGDAGIESVFNCIRRSFRPYATFIFEPPSDLTDIRMWIGFAPASLKTISNPAMGGVSLLALRFATDVGDATFQVIGCDGSVWTSVNTLIAPSDATLFKFEIGLPGPSGQYEFRLTKLKGGTGYFYGTLDPASTPAPALNADIGIVASVRSLAAATKNLKLVSVHVEQNAYDPS